MPKKKRDEIDPGVIFTEEELEIEDIFTLKNAVCSNFKLRERLGKITEAFDEEGKDNPFSKPSALMRKGIAYWILNNISEAISFLEKAWSSKITNYFLGCCYLETGKYDAAHKLLEPLHKENPKETAMLFTLIEAKIQTGLYEDALNLVQKSKKEFHEKPEIYFYTGWCLERLGQYPEMIKAYETVLRNKPNHIPTLFRLAYNLDRMGEDEQALELYERIKVTKPPHINSLINLGLLYEDKGNYQSAAECYKLVLDYYPGHQRAELYLKDARASLNMYYDEEQKRREGQMKRLLNTSLAEFQLSVRCRAALNKLRLTTIGDLTNKTEDQLLKLENFGMTSLAEIKELLARKGLALSGGRPIDASAGSFSAQSPLGEPVKTTDILAKSVFTLDWSTRSRNCLQRLKVYTIGDLIKKTETELLNTKNFGRTSLNEIKQRLSAFGLTFQPGTE